MKKVLTILSIVLILTLAGSSRTSFGKQTQATSDVAVQEKLDQVLKNQNNILAELKYLKEQIDIIRVRASRR
jgi:peptidoglycan hydrolase CwlO-like protein